MIGVIGAGVSGLALGFHLREAGIPHAVFESSGRVGGVVGSETLASGVVDWGPQRLRLTPEINAIVHRLGIEEQLEYAPEDSPLRIVRRGRLYPVPTTPSALLHSDLLSARGRLRLLLEPWTGGVRSDESIGRYFERKLGREVYRVLVGPLFGGLYASDPERMPVDAALLPTLHRLGVRRSLLAAWARRGRSGVTTPPAVNFVGGMDTFVRALAAFDAEAIRVETPVRRLESMGKGIRIHTDHDVTDVERVVVTTPAGVAGSLLTELAPELSRTLRSLRYNPLALVYLRSAFREKGFGYQVAFGEPLRTRGVTWNGSLFDRPGRFTAFLGGMTDPDIVAEDDGKVGRIAEEEFERVTGAKAMADRVFRSRIPAWDRGWTGLAAHSLPPNVALCANYWGRPGLPGRFAAARALVSRWSAERRTGDG